MRFPSALRSTTTVVGIATVALLAAACGNEAEPSEQTSKHDEAAIMAAGFSAETVIDDLELPTAMRFAPDGRIFVSEKRGLIKMYTGLGGTPVQVADLRTEVMDYWDRGLLDIAVNPEFPAKPYIYAYYQMDGKLGDSVAAGTVPRYRDNCTEPSGSCPIVSHLDRIEVNPVSGVMVSKTTLIENWGNQYPSHGVGNMQWGPDGFLYLSGGDGASFSAVDYGQGGNPLGDPPNATGSLTPPTAQGGALRAQVSAPPAGFPAWFNGKILRINPETMTPMLDPRAVPAPMPIVAKGLRNPFRMTFRPSTSELWISDVGWNNWEEINRVPNVTAAATTPLNFGWPCYEGMGRQGGYEGSGLNICQALYSAPGSVSTPFFSYGRDQHVVDNDGCREGGASVTGIAFYNAEAFPEEYRGALFFSDYARECTWYMPLDAGGNPNPAQRQLFARGAGAAVQLTVGSDGDLYFVDIQGGRIGRFHYTVDNRVPQAVLTASATSGLPPFSVVFDASASTDPDPGDSLTFAWDLDDDGAFDDATGAVVTHVFTSLQSVTVKVRATDSKGGSSVASTLITAGNPPTASIQVLTGNNWAVGDTITVAGSATDAEDGVLDASAFDWSIIIQHCPNGQTCHAHVLEELGDLAQVSLIGPDHDYPAHVEIVLTATDSDGLSSTTSVALHPAASNITVSSQPAGLRVALNETAGPAPLTRTVIRGSTTTVSAPEQVNNGTLYRWQSWSDGGAATHAFHPQQASLALTATFAPVAVEQNLAPTATPIALIVAPTGSGSHDLAVIKDGVKPPLNSNNPAQQYDTYAGGGERAADWIGYTLPAPKLVTRVVFQEGLNFGDGGAYDTLTVQTRSNGVWSNVSNLSITPVYGMLNGVNYETYELIFTPQVGDAVRLYGAPAGSAHFISVAELEVYGVDAPGTPGNLPPLANAGADRNVNINSAVTLAGSGSDPEGAQLSYAWTQTGGPNVVLSGANGATPSFVAPASVASLVFQLVTSDGTLTSQPDTVTITVDDPNPPSEINLTQLGTPIALITAPTGLGSKSLATLQDGVKPPVGSVNPGQQYDTYNGGGPRANDWLGYTFTGTKQFSRVVFQEGASFPDGGSFSSLGLQVRNAGVWSDVSGVVFNPGYAGPNGVAFETFQLTFPAVSGDGIRIYGTPAGSAHFVSVAELEVYGSNQAGPPPNLPPTANAGPDRDVFINAVVTLNGSGSDPEGAAVTYAWSQTGGPPVTLSSASAASPTFAAPSGPTSLTFQLVTSDGSNLSVPDAVVVNVGLPANLKPTANAGPDRSVPFNASVTLAGAGSDPEGAAISYLWTQIGGPAVTLGGATTPSPSFTAPAVVTTLTFQLVTNDGVQSSSADSVLVTVNDPNPPSNTNITAAGTPIALIVAPTGGGNHNLAIIKDGVKPAVGSGNSALQYDTYNGGAARPNDWIGYSFTGTKQFNRLLFQEGMNFWDGGGYVLGSLTVQVRIAGVWTNVTGLVSSPAYPGLNNVNFETYQLNFDPISGDGIRIFGTPAGGARFISIAELEVYGSDQAGPPPNLPPSANAGPDQTVNVGSVVTLTGSGSDPEGVAITYAWTQIGGPVVSLAAASTATPSFTAPTAATTLSFQLVTSAGTQNSTADTIDVFVSDPSNVNLTAAGTPIALITAPTGIGSKNLSVIKDGVKPALGTNNTALQYDTYNGGGARPSDWVGYTFTSPHLFNRLVFQEGMSFGDGGALTSASLTVQVRINGTWTNVNGLLVTPSYPGLNGVGFESFQLIFAAISGDGIRIFGTPAGSAHFFSVAELEVYGN